MLMQSNRDRLLDRRQDEESEKDPGDERWLGRQMNMMMFYIQKVSYIDENLYYTLLYKILGLHMQ